MNKPKNARSKDAEALIKLMSYYPIFKNVDLSTISEPLKFCRIKELKEGELLLSPSEPNTQLFILVEGLLTVHTELHMEPVATIRRGDCFGEMSLFEGELPSAYVVAIQPVRVLGIHKEIIWQLIDGDNKFAQNMLHMLLRRISSGNEALAEVQEKLQVQEVSTFVDPLTGIYNRRWLNSMFNRVIERALKSDQECEKVFLLMIDIDHFKEFNDVYGHLSGDQCLRMAASTLRDKMRPTDLLSRYGGEEFSVLLSGASISDCRIVAERLRRAVADKKIKDRHGNELPSVTISIGIAQLKHNDSIEDLFERADKSLYHAKENGRNRICFDGS